MDAAKQQTHFQVDHTYEVKGVGCVVSGTVVSGQVGVGQTLHLGPHGQGTFTAVEVTCIQRSQVMYVFADHEPKFPRHMQCDGRVKVSAQAMTH